MTTTPTTKPIASKELHPTTPQGPRPAELVEEPGVVLKRLQRAVAHLVQHHKQATGETIPA